MSVTDQYLINSIIYRTLENGDADANLTLLTDMFTMQEIIDSMNRVQQQFLSYTGLTLTRTVLPAFVGQARYDLPVDSIRPRRITWQTIAQPAGAPVVFADDYTARSGPLGPAYLPDPTNAYVFTPQGLQQPVIPGPSWYVLLAGTTQGDQSATLTIPSFALTSSYSVGLFLRVSGTPQTPTSYYALGLSASAPQLTIYTYISGSVSILASQASIAIPDNSTLTFTLSGNTLTGYLNGVQILQVVDNQLALGTVGFLTTGPPVATFAATITPLSQSFITALPQSDTWELDNSIDAWSNEQGTPFTWHETTLPQQTLALAPTPGDIGQIGLLYVALGKAVDATGVLLSVPDDWTPYILWGTLKELLSSDGPSFDPLRAQYCGQRFDEGVELARLVLGGS